MNLVATLLEKFEGPKASVLPFFEFSAKSFYPLADPVLQGARGKL